MLLGLTIAHQRFRGRDDVKIGWSLALVLVKATRMLQPKVL